MLSLYILTVVLNDYVRGAEIDEASNKIFTREKMF